MVKAMYMIKSEKEKIKQSN